MRSPLYNRTSNEHGRCFSGEKLVFGDTKWMICGLECPHIQMWNTCDGQWESFWISDLRILIIVEIRNTMWILSYIAFPSCLPGRCPFRRRYLVYMERELIKCNIKLLDKPKDVRYNSSTLKDNIAGWSSSVARRAHNPKAVGSNPAPATMLCNQKRYCTGKPRNHNGFWAFSYPDFQVQTKRYFSLLRGLELPTPTISGGFQEDFSSESRLFFVFAENFF